MVARGDAHHFDACAELGRTRARSDPFVYSVWTFGGRCARLARTVG